MFLSNSAPSLSRSIKRRVVKFYGIVQVTWIIQYYNIMVSNMFVCKFRVVWQFLWGQIVFIKTKTHNHGHSYFYYTC